MKTFKAYGAMAIALGAIILLQQIVLGSWAAMSEVEMAYRADLVVVGKLSDKKLVSAYTVRGGAHLNLNHLDQSLSDLNEALRRNPKEKQALFGRGLAHGRLKDLEAARSDLQQACRLGHDEACKAIQ